MLSERIAIYEQYKDDKAELKAHKPKTYSQWKQEYPWLYDVDNYALGNAQIQLKAAYDNFFRDKKIGFPKFRSKKTWQNRYTTNSWKNYIRIEDGRVCLPKIGFVELIEHRTIPDAHKIKSATISLSPSGKYFISITTEYDWEPPVIELSKDRTLGLDYSSPHFYVDSQGVEADMPHFYREAESKLAREQRKLDKMQYGSTNYGKQRLKVAKYHAKVASCRKDWLHKQSRVLADTWDYICVEDINLNGMARVLRLAKSTYDNGFGMFRDFLKYKLEDSGKVFVKIDKWFPSSKMCSKCGGINIGLKLSDREWTCECGAHHDRDLNAAINIRNLGLFMVG